MHVLTHLLLANHDQHEISVPGRKLGSRFEGQVHAFAFGVMTEQEKTFLLRTDAKLRPHLGAEARGQGGALQVNTVPNQPTSMAGNSSSQHELQNSLTYGHVINGTA